MKLSEAIRLGAMLKPQAFGEFVDDMGGTCALGAAAQAVHLPLDHSFSGISDYWPFTNNDVMCPNAICGSAWATSIADTITHLNDDHEWTREQIADWVATIEPADEPHAPPETLAAVDPQVEVLESGTRA